jgi:hypothetical protein
MKIWTKIAAVFLLLDGLFLFSACGDNVKTAPVQTNPAPTVAVETNTKTDPPPTPKVPNLQTELLDERNKTTVSPLGKFDFKNFTYKLPRGWQNAEGEITLENGKSPVSISEEEKRKIGASFVTTKFADADGDGVDEALVIIKIETGGSAIPQMVYIYGWKNDAPNLLWYFRTGDRADGGLKDIRVENGNLVIEVFGQDRYILGEVETSKITNDEEQICCPTHFTRSNYKWNGSTFRLEGKRLTFLTADKNAPPIENMIEAAEKLEKQNSGKK